MSLAKSISIRSSLFPFPSFYACYLLKSLKKFTTRPTYIGSTSSPPRRIRQHNGELSQGARKTRLNRPWVMQMVVYGLPSKLAALQFEWAWQHPRKSRHIRGVEIGRRLNVLQKNILIIRTMISMSPFNTWPLHVKLFTHEAEQYWEYSNDVAHPLPPGFTCSLELEGVDGESGHVGSGRQGPISIDDEEFASTILPKDAVIAAAGGKVECSICREPILNYAVNPLSTALCPSSNCHAVSHLKCLSQYFINQQDQPKTMVPRGGHCKSCEEYTLWGDVIRGCYRRMRSYSSTGHQLSDNLEVQETKKSASPRRRKSSKVKETQEPCSSSTPKPRRSRKILEVVSSPTMRRMPSKGGRKQKQPANPVFTTEGENLDFVANSKIEDSATLMKKKRGRPRKNLALLSPETSSSVSSPCSLKPSRKPKKIASPTMRRLPSKGSRKRKQFVFTTEGENLDLVANSKIEDSATLMKKKRGRPRKNLALLSPETSSSVSSPCSLKPSRKPKKIASPTMRRLPSKSSRKRKQPVFTTEGENLDLVASPEIEDSTTLVKKRCGRPPKSLALLSPEVSSSVSSPCSLKPSRKPKKSASPAKPKLSSKGKGNIRKRVSPAKLKLSSKGDQSSAPYQTGKASTRKKSKTVTLTKY